MIHDKFVLSAGQCHEIEMAMNREGVDPWTQELVHKLAKGDNLNLIRQVILGNAEVKLGLYEVDLDADPSCPYCHDEGNKLRLGDSNRQGSRRFMVDGVKRKRVCHESEKIPLDEMKFRLEKLRDENLVAANAALLDFLLENTVLIPTSLEPRVAFWGTLYWNKKGDPHVRVLQKGHRSFNDICLPVDEEVMRIPVAVIPFRE